VVFFSKTQKARAFFVFGGGGGGGGGGGDCHTSPKKRGAPGVFRGGGGGQFRGGRKFGFRIFKVGEGHGGGPPFAGVFWKKKRKGLEFWGEGGLYC